MTIRATPLRRGEWQVLVLVRNERCPAPDYLVSLPLRDRKRAESLFSLVAEEGPPASVEKNRKIAEHLWELKSYQARFPYFFDGPRRIVITHGFTKKQPKLPRNELERAQRLRAEYLEERR